MPLLDVEAVLFPYIYNELGLVKLSILTPKNKC